MGVHAYGVNFQNKKGEFCTRAKYDHYFLSHFRSDYMIEVDGRLVRGRAGDVYIAAPGTVIYHGPTAEMNEGFTNDWMHVDGERLGQLLNKYPLPMGTPFRVDNPFYLTSAIERISDELSCLEVGYEDKCELIISDALVELYRSYKRIGSVGREARLDFVHGELMKDYKRAWTLSDMAKLSGYSESRFSALYKEYYGISPINDLLNRRLDRAKLFLLYGNMQMSEIAEEVGFSSLFYFSKQFKLREGISPSEFRQKGINRG